MKKIIGVLFCVVVPYLFYAQEKGAVGIEINSNLNLINTNELNDYIDGVISDWPDNMTLLNREKMTIGRDFGLSLNYQVASLFNIGIYSKFSKGQSINDFRTIIPSEPIMGIPADTVYNGVTYTMTNTIIGIYSNFSINNMAFWPKENWLSRVESKVTIGVGYSYSRFINSGEPKLIKGFFGEVNPVSGIHLMGNLKIGYKLVKNPVFSSVGIQAGYQYLITSHLKGESLITFKENEAPRLNFSGLTAGIYLTFGK